MTCGDIINFACATTGDISSDALSYARQALKLKYATLYDAHLWRESMRTMEGVALNPALNGAFFLPYDAEEIIYCSMGYDGINYTRLSYRERDWIERNLYPHYALPGYVPWFYRAENLAWPAFNPGQLTLTCASWSPFTAYVSGIDQNGLPVNESFFMQGTITGDGSAVNPTSVTTVNSYATVLSLSKDTRTEWMNVTDSTQTIRMPEGLSEFVFTQMILYPLPASTNPDGSNRQIYLRVQVKLKPDSLSNDLDVPRISHIWDALICFVTGSMYLRLGQGDLSQQQEQTAMEHVKAAVQVEKAQSEMRQQAVPIIYESGDYLRYYHGSGIWSGNPFGT